MAQLLYIHVQELLTQFAGYLRRRPLGVLGRLVLRTRPTEPEVYESWRQRRDIGCYEAQPTAANVRAYELLFVEDDSDLRRALTEYLRRRGYVVTACATCRQRLPEHAASARLERLCKLIGLPEF